jgi:hypothetical protein
MHRRATASLTGAYTPIRLQEGLRLRFSAKDPLNSAFLDGGRANTRRWVCRGTARPCVVGRHQLSQRSSTLSSPPLTRWVCVGGGLAVSRGGRIDTQLFNGYADQVSYLYDGVEGEALYM